MVMLIGVLSYGIRGIYWATLDDCDVSAGTRGLAVGVISLLAYTPDIYVPVVQSWCMETWPDKQAIRSTTASRRVRCRGFYCSLSAFCAGTAEPGGRLSAIPTAITPHQMETLPVRPVIQLQHPTGRMKLQPQCNLAILACQRPWPADNLETPNPIA